MDLDKTTRAAMLAYEAHRVGAEQHGVTLKPWTDLTDEDRAQHRDTVAVARTNPEHFQPEYNAIVNTVFGSASSIS